MIVVPHLVCHDFGRFVKGSLRSSFAAIFALALACVGVGVRGAPEPPAPPAASLRETHRDRSIDTRQTPALVLLRAGTLVLDGPPRRAGAMPRIAPGDGGAHADDAWLAARTALRRAAGERTRRILTLALARQLAAARDGTLSSRSTGVPPPSRA
jgi:hypothetical protein